MPEFPIDHPKVRAAFKDLLFHPKFSAFLDDFSGEDPLINAVYDKIAEIAFPGLTREQIRRMRDVYLNKQHNQHQNKRKKKLVVV